MPTCIYILAQEADPKCLVDFSPGVSSVFSLVYPVYLQWVTLMLGVFPKGSCHKPIWLTSSSRMKKRSPRQGILLLRHGCQPAPRPNVVMQGCCLTCMPGNPQRPLQRCPKLLLRPCRSPAVLQLLLRALPFLERLACLGSVVFQQPHPWVSAMPSSERSLWQLWKLGSRYSELFSTTPRVDVSMIPRLVDQVLGAHEEETLGRVAKTWQELALWADTRNLIVGKMSAVEVAAFVENSSAPARILSAMQFLNKRLYFELYLTLAMDLRKTKQSVIGLGQRQAPVVQPILLAKLEESISYSIIGGDAKWLGLYATWCVATGCVRWAHVQRSRLLHMTETSMVFECLRGKQIQRRCGFFWSCPRYSIFEHTDFGQAFLQCVEDLPKDHACIAFELETLAEIPHRVAKSQVAQCLVHEVGAEDLRRITSKSWRQFSVTWAFLSKIDATQVLALGNWIEATEKGASTTAWRYHRGKLQQSQELKLLMARCIKCLVLEHDGHSWHQIPQDVAVRVRQEQERMILAVDRIVAELHHPDSRMSEQVVQLENSAFLKKIRRKRVSRGEKAESDSVVMAPVPVKAMPASLFLPLAPSESKKRPVQAEPFRASGSSMGSHDKPPEPSAAPPQAVATAIPPTPVPAPLADETAEELYDRLSRDPGNPRASRRTPALILGPLPTGNFGPSSRSTTWRPWSPALRSPFTPKVGLCHKIPWWPNFPLLTSVGWSRSWKQPGMRLLRCSTWPSKQMRASTCIAWLAVTEPLFLQELFLASLLGPTLIQPWLTSDKSGTFSRRRCSETAATPRWLDGFVKLAIAAALSHQLCIFVWSFAAATPAIVSGMFEHQVLRALLFDLRANGAKPPSMRKVHLLPMWSCWTREKMVPAVCQQLASWSPRCVA